MKKGLKKAKNIGIVVKIGNEKAIKLADELAEWLLEKDYKVFGETLLADDSRYLESVPPEKLKDNIDMLIILGGDGTMLYGARLLGGEKIPLLGINLGGLGFLTAAPAGEVYTALEKFVEGELGIEDRMMLDVEVVRNNEVIAEYKALNDVVIKANIARLICLDVAVDNRNGVVSVYL